MKYIGKYLSEEILLTRECSSEYSEIINQPFNGLIYYYRCNCLGDHVLLFD